jgi:hypothetical protein
LYRFTVDCRSASIASAVALSIESSCYLNHFGGAKQSTTRTARIEKAAPAIFEGRGFLERRSIVKAFAPPRGRPSVSGRAA